MFYTSGARVLPADSSVTIGAVQIRDDWILVYRVEIATYLRWFEGDFTTFQKHAPKNDMTDGIIPSANSPVIDRSGDRPLQLSSYYSVSTR